MSEISWCHCDRPPRIVVMGTPERQRVQAAWRRLRPVIAASAEIVAEDFSFAYEFTNRDDVDLVIVLGGDGSILQSARQMGAHQVPVLGINCGHLGFLAALSPEDFLDAWPRVCEGDFHVIDHLMLQVQIIRGDAVVAEQLALNEAAVLSGPPFSILDIDYYADGELATQYRCDGLIVATPVGSTAHSLSAGGPIVRRQLQAMILSPISPHTLTYRPVVESADTLIELTVTEPLPTTCILVDGRVLGALLAGDRVRIQRSPVSFRMLRVPGQNDYRTLREKLGWSGSLNLRR
ncbi:putative inorganic polyphosphate/ATP-NAD kinase [Allorhodopirellula heiligendammensis]|uniref:NAD kinase n=2 Tax=Allorhodopirellula heiligendammensis TaxID=2714739 RepID=A0A5C6BUL9_9BACT|nr:NAD(+)/NADH kinase [Allorhodopirellula heiligendammensis]TWU15542.1 putative inorganic polyphosphate/ATP-NAD kinase [Allorhodopirellula heiligendammensis]